MASYCGEDHRLGPGHGEDLMRTAILACHEYSVPGGAERLEIDMAEALDATIVCLRLDPSFVTVYPRAKGIRFHSLDVTLPSEPLRQILGMLLFRRLKLDYDFFIVMDDMAMRYLRKDVPHLYYMHTPRRAFYDMYYPTLAGKPLFTRQIWKVLIGIFRSLDQRFVKKHVRHIACNAHNTRNRIWKAYQREAVVIYPPTHTDLYTQKGYGDYWLSVTRVDKWKRIELQIETFRKLPDKRLKIAGRIYPEFQKVVSTAPPNVEFLGSVPDEELLSLYSQCRGFLTTAIDEDFGITPVEAMACGKPVIAVKEGGYLETVIDGHTGHLVAPDPEEIARAIIIADTDPGRYESASLIQASTFDYRWFRDQMRKYRDIIQEREE